MAYTTLINHQKCDNRIAYQIFTKFGPIAFLPCSNKETSIVFSMFKPNKDIKKEEEILKLIEKYNKKYLIKSFSKIEKFNLKSLLLKNYHNNNILCFGDNIHKIHPLAGQGLNMTIRDISILSELIDKKKELGLCLDKSIFRDFENKTKAHEYRVKFIHWIKIRYGLLLLKVMRYPKRTLSGLVGLFILSIVALGSGLIRMDFFASDNIRLFYVNVEMPTTSSLAETMEKVLAVEKITESKMLEGEVRSIVSYSGQIFT